MQSEGQSVHSGSFTGSRRRSPVGKGRRHTRLGLVLALLLSGILVPVVAATSAEAADDWLYRPAGGTFAVRGHGEGHGRGMSQYGAQGAASQGLSSAQILDFYYPGTASTQVDPNRQLRVYISGDDDNVTEVVRAADLVVTDTASGIVIPIPANADRVRTVVNGGGFAVHARIGGTWVGLNQNPAGPVQFSSNGWLELVKPNGDRLGIRGVLLASRSGAGAVTVNRLRLDDYVRAVVPRESPSSWRPAALQSQAVAARTYASAYRSSNSAYDICDTARCQVYGGGTLNGVNLETVNTNNATDATSGLIRTYNGSPINAQFGSTNGGWTVNGGVPYLPAQPDPYEAAANPPQSYANWAGTLQVGDLESDFPSIGSFQRLRITARDGNGEWGGRVVSATLVGSAGTVNITGDQLRLALTAAVRSAYFQLFNPDTGNAPFGRVDVGSGQLGGALISGWAVDANAPFEPVTINVYDFSPWGLIPLASVRADQSRPDVGAAFPGVGNAHGFATALTLAGGRGQHTVCAYAANIGAGNTDTLIGCFPVFVGAPFGYLDSLTGGAGFLTASGWALDPAVPTTPEEIFVLDVGPVATRGYTGTIAGEQRLDINAAFPGIGGAHGYTARIPVVDPGWHTVCIIGIPGYSGADNTWLGCRGINVVNPIGAVAPPTATSGGVAVNGWVIDPGNPLAAATVRLRASDANGASADYTFVAGKARQDVADFFGWSGPYHGFDETLPLRGATSVCAWAVSVGPSVQDVDLGCQSVTR